MTTTSPSLPDNAKPKPVLVCRKAGGGSQEAVALIGLLGQSSFSWGTKNSHSIIAV